MDYFYDYMTRWSTPERKPDMKDFKPRQYKGVTIERIFPSGYYSAFIVNLGYFRADTLAGVKELIREAIGR